MLLQRADGETCGVLAHHACVSAFKDVFKHRRLGVRKFVCTERTHVSALRRCLWWLTTEALLKLRLEEMVKSLAP